MIAGASWTWWIGFHVAVALLLAVDAALPSHRRDAAPTNKAAWIWTIVLFLASAVFAGWVGYAFGRQRALEFVAGYTIETSLSIDNLFVFLVLFQGFHIRAHRQHTALLWGVMGAIVLRGIFIAAGVTLLERFSWINWIFGVILLYASIRLLRGGSTHAAIPEWLRRFQSGKSSLLPVIIAVEVTDLLFAVDSIPAVLAISHDPFIVYTSNIAAILGLRSLYFVLVSLLDRFRHLHYAIGLLLLFVAFKMLADPWLDISVTVSLIVIGAILALFAIVSAIAGPKPDSKPKSKTGPKPGSEPDSVH